MPESILLLCFFLFVAASVGAILLLFRWRAEPRIQAEADESPLVQSMTLLGEITPLAKTKRPPRDVLAAAGYRDPDAAAIFQGVRVAGALGCSVILGWVGLLANESVSGAILLAICGAGFGFLLPDRILEAKARARAGALDAALPNALDLMVLSVEAGQSLDSAIAESGRELRGLYPELSEEFAQVQLELRAGRTRAEVLYNLGTRTGSRELKKFSNVLIDTDRFGVSLGPALRTHARYLRTRRRHEAQESARKLSVKLIFPVFFFIMPSVFVITLGPAVLTIFDALGPSLNL